MTDEQIIKALECCKSFDDLRACYKCPALENGDCSNGKVYISNFILDKALNLINRQQEEIERLTALCTEQNEELDRLQKVRANILKVMKENISQTKAEAIKEFAIVIKNRMFFGKNLDYEREFIDNLVKKWSNQSTISQVKTRNKRTILRSESMAKLHLKGYLCSDCDGIIALREKSDEECSYWESEGTPITKSIKPFADENGMVGNHNKGLGGTRTFIDDCNLRAYFTDKECELEEAMMAMDVLMYGGDIKTRVDKVGYSEWTITGLDLVEFSIGGHDLRSEFKSHCGEYCHLIIEY